MEKIEEKVEKTILPEEIFLRRLGDITIKKKAISNKRIWHLADLSLEEAGKNTGDLILDYMPAVKGAQEIAGSYLADRGYVKTRRGYVPK